MDYKVMSDKEIIELALRECDCEIEISDIDRTIAEAQAKISWDTAYKAGQMDRLFGVMDFIHYWNRGMEGLVEWKAQLKHWGINEKPSDGNTEG